MSVLIDDKLPRHPKILRVSAEAAWFFVCGLCYCREHSPDGTIPNDALNFLGKHRRPKALAKELVDVVLWETCEGGFRVHDYFDWNPTAEQVRAKRKKTAERVQRWRERTYGNGVTSQSGNGVTNADVTDSNTVPFRSVPPSGESAPLEQKFSPGERHDAAEAYAEAARTHTSTGVWAFASARGGDRDVAANTIEAYAPRLDPIARRAWVADRIREWVAADPSAAAKGLSPFRFADWMRAQQLAAPKPQSHAAPAYQPFRGHRS